MSEVPFWKAKTLRQMTRQEWESLCDGCGTCCVHKLLDEDEGRVWYTRVACRLLDTKTCRCTDYANRKRKVPDCVVLTPARIHEVTWMPPTCAYRLIHEGRDLFPWHPLISGDPESVHRAGISARGRLVPEDQVDLDDLEDYIVDDDV